MKIKICCAAILGLMLMVCQPCFAAMGSANFTIPTSVMSGGGAPMGSGSFQSNGTLGQPSPLQPAPAASTNFDLYPGFWYTMFISNCIWDLDPVDGDVDGSDLYRFIDSHGASDIENFGSEFGRTDCL